MKIVLCPDKLKGSLSAEKVCSALMEGLKSSHKNLMIDSCPMADGGDGSINLLKEILHLKAVQLQTTDPIGNNILAKYFISHDAAFIELASASGLALLNDKDKNPLYTSTSGTGNMIMHAFENGFHKVYLFIGGSATNDGGIGIANALGFDFYSKEGQPLKLNGGNLENIDSIANNKQIDISKLELIVLCDVNNPMHGANGAAHIYAAQKGANQADILKLENGLKNYDKILKKQYQKDIANMEGMGAAGAVSASLVGLLNAELKPGFQMLSDIFQLENRIKNADLVITGEGKIDSTSFQGKVVGNVLSLCKKHNTPCALVGGMIEENKSDAVYKKSIISIAKDFEDAMSNSEKYLKEIGFEIGKNI